MAGISEGSLRVVMDHLSTHTVEETAKEFGLKKESVHRYKHRWKQMGNEMPDNIKDAEKTEERKQITQEYSKNKAYITTKSLNIKSVDDALRESEVDTKKWKVEKHTINTWETTTKLRKYEKDKDGNVVRVDDQPETYTNYQVKVWLERIKQTEDELAVEKLIKRLYKQPIKHCPVCYDDVEGQHMLEISLYDHHFGMLAWSDETNEDYDLKLAEEIYVDTVVKMLKRTKHYSIDKIIFPLGQDFFHINTPDNLTPKSKNRLDVDTRLAKIIEIGERAFLKAVEQCRAIAPVQVLWVPGNHDPETSYYLAKIVKAYYHNTEDVEVDCSPILRKYIRYGDVLLGYTHGSEEPHDKLPTIMADEVSDLWSDTTYKEWHLGHYHKRKEMKYVSTNSYGGTIVRILPSLCGTDFWHYKKGYVGRNRSAECYMYSKSEGPIGYFTVHI